MNYPECTDHEVANLWIHTMKFAKAGDNWQDGGHVHTYDHAHFVSNGSMRVVVNGQTTDYTAPALIYIKAGLTHLMIALADNTIGHCIHALRSQDGSGEPLDPLIVPNGVSVWKFAAPPTD